MSTIFRNRQHAGQVLAQHLLGYAHYPDALVLGLPRGGVPVAFEVACALELPLDVFVVRKLGVPGREELAMGAVATGGIRVVNDALIASLGVSGAELEAVTAAERTELARREVDYRGDQPPPIVRDRTILLVDDGMATGASMFAAITALRQRQPARVVAAVPVAAPATCQQVGELADEVVCAITPEPFYAVGLWYDDFEQIDDAAIHALLRQRSLALHPLPPPPTDPAPTTAPLSPAPPAATPPQNEPPEPPDPPDAIAPPRTDPSAELLERPETPPPTDGTSAEHAR